MSEPVMPLPLLAGEGHGVGLISEAPLPTGHSDIRPPPEVKTALETNGRRAA